MFISQHASVELDFTCPPAFCCNCGRRGATEFGRTPLRLTRYFLFFGSELTLYQGLPYCRGCLRSAKRVRLGLGSRVLMALMLAAVLFLTLVLVAPPLPMVVSEHLFACSLLVALPLAFAYFRWRSRAAAPTYYQPVSLLSVTIDGGRLEHVTIGFHNHAYAQVFADANADAIAAGLLRVGAV